MAEKMTLQQVWIALGGRGKASHKKLAEVFGLRMLPQPDDAHLTQPAQAVAKVRHFDYRGIARNGFSQEAEMLDGAPTLPDGTLLYTKRAIGNAQAEGWKVPDAKPLPDLMLASYHEAVGWNACRAAMLATLPTPPQPEE